MLATFESILPIFLLIVAGIGLRRLPLIDDRAWPGLEQLAYWFLYPVLLFVSIYNADFTGLRLDALLVVLIVGITLMIGLVLAMWPLLRATGIAERGEYSSLFQTAIRWNGFMALAIAEKIFPAQGAAVVALVMAVIIIPINMASVAVVAHFAARASSPLSTLRAVATNPLIVAASLAVVLRLVPVPLYQPVNDTLALVGSAALGLGLVTIGAGLRLGDLATSRLALWLPVLLKLAVFPALILGLSLAIGIDGPELRYLALCAAVPTAMNGYLLARQMGGDAELYAAVTTLQTVLSFISIPIVLAVAAQMSSG